MNYRSRIQALTVVLTVAALFVAALPGGAEAAVKKIKQDKLISSRNNQLEIRTPFYTTCLTGPCFFYYPLKLPVGTVFKGLSYQHSAEGNGHTIVGLNRVKAGASPSLQNLFEGEKFEDTGSIYETVQADGVPQAGVTKKVQKGWDYFVSVQVDGTLGPPVGAVGTIKITYNPPAP